jgi:hypothetical protein
MKTCCILIIASAVATLPVVAAEGKEEKQTAAPAVQVVLKRTKLPSRDELDEVRSTSAVVDDQVEGKLAINIGTAERPQFRTVEFGDEGEGWIQVSVTDTSKLREEVHEGTNWIAPLELFRITAPFDGSGTVTVYQTKTELLTLEVTSAAAATVEKPEAE